MNKTQRVVLRKQNEVSASLCEARSRGVVKAACSVRRSRMGATLFVALAPVSLLAVSPASSAALVDNLANVSSDRAQVYSSQVREALSAVTPSAAGSSGEGGRRLAAAALSGPILTPDQMIVSGPTDSSNQTSAVGTNAVAMGVNVRAAGEYSVAAGSYASAESGSVALGSGVLAAGNESTALGVRSWADADHSLAVGWRTSVDSNATDSLAIGSGTRVHSAAAGAIGKDNSVGGAGSYVIGNSNSALGADSFVLGSNVTARGQNSIVLGARSDGSLNNVVSVGNVGTERRIVHVAPGLNPMDAVNMSQFNALDERASGSVAYDTASKNVITLGGQAGAPAVVLTNLKAGVLSAQSTDAVNGAQLNATNSDVHDITSSLTLLTRAEPLKLAYTDDGKSSIVLGGASGTILSNVKAGVADQDAVNVAQLKNAGLIDPTGNMIAAITYDSKADGSVNRNSVTLGGSDARLPVALHNVAAGVVKAGSTDAVNGDQLFQTAQLVDGLQNGAALKYFVSGTTLSAATASGLNATAIGGNAQAIAGNTVALGANSVADRLNSVSVGAAGNERQITNVQAGTADTDAVNVGQLKSAGLVDQTGKAVTALSYDKNASGATDFGSVTLGQGIAGGTAIHNLAAGTLATDAVNLGQLNDIVTHVSNFVTSSSALYSAAGDASTEAAIASGTHAVAMGANATASAANSVALGAGSLADRASSVSVGAAGSERQITNVAAGTSATDAVNLSQLNQSASSTLSQANSYTDQRFNNTDQQIRDLDRNTRKGIASASALNVVTPYLPGRTTLNAGVAAYRGQAALGIGVSRWNDKGNINFNGGVSSSGGNSTIVRAGVGYVFGS